jgi:hypothetical protein
MKIFKTRQGSSGFSVSFRIVKGLRYKVGNYRPHYVCHDELTEVGTGELHVIDKRIVFDGFPRSVGHPYSRILDIELHKNGIEVSRSSGKNYFFQLSELDAEYVIMLATHFQKSYGEKHG